jgi:hypothetical protein
LVAVVSTTAGTGTSWILSVTDNLAVLALCASPNSTFSNDAKWKCMMLQTVLTVEELQPVK